MFKKVDLKKWPLEYAQGVFHIWLGYLMFGPKLPRKINKANISINIL